MLKSIPCHSTNELTIACLGRAWALGELWQVAFVLHKLKIYLYVNRKKNLNLQNVKNKQNTENYRYLY